MAGADNLVLKFLSRMDRGRLDLELPGGESIAIGDGRDPVRARICIRDAAFYKQCILYGDIGFGEAYVDGLWDTDNITQVIKWFLLNIDNNPAASGGKKQALALNLLKWFNKISHFKRANSIDGSRKNISEHYDLNNDFFASFLD